MYRKCENCYCGRVKASIVEIRTSLSRYQRRLPESALACLSSNSAIAGFNQSGLRHRQGAKTHKDVRPIELAGLPVSETRNKAREKSFCETHPTLSKDMFSRIPFTIKQFTLRKIKN